MIIKLLLLKLGLNINFFIFYARILFSGIKVARMKNIWTTLLWTPRNKQILHSLIFNNRTENFTFYLDFLRFGNWCVTHNFFLGHFSLLQFLQVFLMLIILWLRLGRLIKVFSKTLFYWIYYLICFWFLLLRIYFNFNLFFYNFCLNLFIFLRFLIQLNARVRGTFIRISNWFLSFAMIIEILWLFKR
jgi:hypothetical protein